jgi:hypothetical protein
MKILRDAAIAQDMDHVTNIEFPNLRNRRNLRISLVCTQRNKKSRAQILARLRIGEIDSLPLYRNFVVSTLIVHTDPAVGQYGSFLPDQSRSTRDGLETTIQNRKSKFASRGHVFSGVLT